MNSDWPLHSLSDFINVKHGFAFKGEFFKGERTSDLLVTPGNFAIGGGFKSDKFKYYEGPIPEDYVLSEGDLIVTMTDLSKQADTLGYSALVPSITGNTLLHNQRVGLVEFKNDELDKAYLYFLLRSKEYRHHVVSTATGSTVKHSSPTKILSFEFRKPPKEVQVDIGEKLIALEEKIQNNSQTNHTLEQIAQALFKSWFVDFDPVKAKIAVLEAGGTAEEAGLAAMEIIAAKNPKQLAELKQSKPEDYAQLAQTAALFPSAMQESELGEIPEDFKVRPFSELAKLDTTSVNPGKQATTLWEHYSIPSFDVDKSPALDFGSTIKSGKYRVQKSSVLSSKLNPHFPRTWWPDIENEECAICSTEFMQFVPHEEEYRSFIYGMITSRPFQEGMQLRVTGSTGSRQRAQPPQVASMGMVVPSDDLISLYSNKLLSLHQKAAKNIKENKQLSSIRDALLPKLLSGEITLSTSKEQTLKASL
jgi:type I restriction enzyme, S subunit